MGAVYEARHTHTDRRVALKVLRGAGPLGDSSREERFAREARVSARIETPHVAQVLDAGTDAVSGARFLVFELLTGEDLEEVVQRARTLPPDTALRIAAQVCRGLARAHDAHVVHRDIKPANLFLAKQADSGRIVKILDFGIAKIRADANAGNDAMTRTGWMLGSPRYMSPEQARGIKEVDHRADIWSVGVVMYRMLCGRTPHEGIEAMGDLIMAICSLAPTPVRSVSPWVPPAVADVVHRALRADPKERFQSADAMLEALLKLLPNGDAIEEKMLARPKNAPPPEQAAGQGETTIHDVSSSGSSPAVTAASSAPPNTDSADKAFRDTGSSDGDAPDTVRPNHPLFRSNDGPESHADTVARSASTLESRRHATATADKDAAAHGAGRPSRSRASLFVALGLAGALGIGLFAVLRGRSDTGARPDNGASEANGVAPNSANAAVSSGSSVTSALATTTSADADKGAPGVSPALSATAATPTGASPSSSNTSSSPAAPLASGKASASAKAPSATGTAAAPRATSQPSAKPSGDPLLPDRME